MNVQNMVQLFQNADRAHGALADGVRAEYEASGIHSAVPSGDSDSKLPRWDGMENAVAALFRVDAPLFGLRTEKREGEKKSPAAAALNLWSATVRSRINSALKAYEVKCAVSIKLDKLRPGAAIVTVEVSEARKNTASFAVRAALESMLKQVGKMTAELSEELSEDEIAAIETMNEAILAAAAAMDSRIS